MSSAGLGPLRIGMTEREVGRIFHGNLKRPFQRDPEYDWDCHYLRAPALPSILFMIEEGRLTRLELEGRSAIRTADGFGIGTTARRLRLCYRTRLRL